MLFCIVKKRLLPAGLGALAALCAASLSPATAWADGVTGYAEYTYSQADSTSQTADRTSKSSSTSFLQRYDLSLSRNFYPTLHFSGSVDLERSNSRATTDGVETSGSVGMISSTSNLSFGNAFAGGGFGYSRNESSTSGSDITDILESYGGRFSLRPEGIPPLDLTVSRSNSYTSDRVGRDTTTDTLVFNTQYSPLRTLNLSYNGSVTRNDDRISLLKSESFTQTVTGGYADSFFRNRVSFFTSGSLSQSETTFSTGSSGGEIPTTLVPNVGYFAVSDTPTLVQLSDPQASPVPPIETWTSLELLTDRHTIVPVSQVNLGVPAVVGGDTRQRNLGMDFGLQANVNTVYVYVDQALPSSVWKQFPWSVYTSSDNVNWTLQPGGAEVGFETVPDPFGQVPQVPQVYRFVLKTSTLVTRYLKVVTAPLPQQLPGSLPQGFDASRIFVTELGAALRTPAAEIPDRKSSSMNALGSAGVRIMLLKGGALPQVSYDANSNYTYSSGGGTSAYTLFLSHGLSALKSFGPRLSTSARVSMDTSRSKGEAAVSSYGYSLMAVARTLPVLTHSLTYSGKQQNGAEGHSTNDSLFITNSAELYRGVSVQLSGGVSRAVSAQNLESVSSLFNVGLNLVPNESLSLNGNFSESRSSQSGPGRADTSSFTRSTAVGWSYIPLKVLYLSGSLGFAESSSQPMTLTQSYSVSYAPLIEGQLTFSVSYVAALTSSGDQKTQTVSPGLHWAIKSGWWVDMSYSYQTFTSAISESTTNAFSTTVRASF